MDTIINEIYRLSMSSDRLDDLLPCFVFDRNRFDRNINSFRKSFHKYFDRFEIAYSTKTNPHPAILKAAKENGIKIEIVSHYEYDEVAKAGFMPDEVIYNGVIPHLFSKYTIASHGGKVNVENIFEMKQIAAIALKEKRKIKIGMRLNINLHGDNGHSSRFGIVPFSPEFFQFLNLQNDYCMINGVHIHIHGGRDIDSWRTRAKKAGEVAAYLRSEYIDFGSNIFGFMDERLSEQFNSNIPSVDEYAKAIFNELGRFYNKMPEIIIEAGTPIVADTVSAVGKVEYIKAGSSTQAVSSCSVYDFGFFHGSDKKVPVDVIHLSDGNQYNGITIYGYACTEDDVVCESYSGELCVGDILVFRNLGSYAYSLCSDFIKPKLKLYELIC